MRERFTRRYVARCGHTRPSPNTGSDMRVSTPSGPADLGHRCAETYLVCAPMESDGRLRCGMLELNARSRELSNGDRRIQLQAQPFEILRRPTSAVSATASPHRRMSPRGSPSRSPSSSCLARRALARRPPRLPPRGRSAPTAAFAETTTYGRKTERWSRRWALHREGH
jgi:hypothetical protein